MKLKKLTMRKRVSELSERIYCVLYAGGIGESGFQLNDDWKMSTMLLGGYFPEPRQVIC